MSETFPQPTSAHVLQGLGRTISVHDTYEDKPPLDTIKSVPFGLSVGPSRAPAREHLPSLRDLEALEHKVPADLNRELSMQAKDMDWDKNVASRQGAK